MAKYAQYAPEFAIQIDGQPMPAAMRACVSSVSYKDGMQGADQVQLTLANPSLQWLDHPLLATDNGFRLKIGYAPDPLEEVFVGEITGVEPSFPSSGMPTIRITAQDFLQRLTHGTKDRAFLIGIPSVGNFPLPDALIAAIVSGTNGLIPALDPVGGALSVIMTLAMYVAVPQAAQLGLGKQKGKTDFQFLTEISKRNGWEMFIDHTADPHGYVLRFQFLVQEYTPALTLKWGSSLMDFTPRLTTVGDVFGVEARVWVDSLKMEFVVSVSWDYDRATFDLQIYPSLIGSVPASAKKQTLSVKPTGLATTPQKILGDLLPRLNNRLTGSGSTIGDPRIKASRVINFEGLGSFSGLYRVTEATHTFDGGGYKTNFSARKEVWFGSVPVPKGVSGIARVNGQFSI